MQSSRRLFFKPDADADLESILQYTLQTWGDDRMRAYSARIFAALDELSTFPNIGKRRDDLRPGLLSYLAAQHIVFYVASEDELTVHRIIHSRRDADAEFIE
jgi:toxin ParE1/3/4